MTWILAAFWLAGAQAQLQDLPTGLAAFLQEAMELDSAQIQAVRSGEAVVTVLDTELQRDIAVFGVAIALVIAALAFHLRRTPRVLRPERDKAP